MRRVTISFAWQTAYWATIAGVLMGLAGFAVLLLGWRGVAALLVVPLQLPYAVSGGMVGLALIGFGAALVNVQVGRHLAAKERVRMAEAVRLGSELLAFVRSDQSRTDSSAAASTS